VARPQNLAVLLTHCGQFIIRKKISKFDATRCQFLRIECTKFDFRDPAQGAYSALPGPLSVFKGLLLRGGKGKMEGKGREREGEEEGKREGMEVEWPVPQIFWPRTARNTSL